MRRYLQRTFLDERSRSVLELGAGTEPDALWLARYGHRVRTVDDSPAPLDGLAARARSRRLEPLVACDQLDSWELGAIDEAEPFDLILSRSGAIAALSPPEIAVLGPRLARRLDPDGRLVLVGWTRWSLWELIGSGLGGRWRRLARRWRGGPIEVPGRSGAVSTWHPRSLARALQPWFRHRHSRALGLALPATPLADRLDRSPLVLAVVDRAEGLLQRQKLARFGEQFLLDLERTEARVEPEDAAGENRAPVSPGAENGVGSGAP